MIFPFPPIRSSLAQPLAITFLLATSGVAMAVCGDCDGDGRMNILDGLLAAQHAAGLTVLSGPEFDACDTDSCGTINVLDALAIAQGAAGLVGTPCSVGGCGGVPGTCAAPIVLTAGVPYQGSNETASNDESTACGSVFAFAPDQVHEITFAGTSSIRVEVTAAFSASVEVRGGSCGGAKSRL